MNGLCPGVETDFSVGGLIRQFGYFFDIARGSGLESAGCLDLLFIKRLVSDAELDEGKSLLKDVVSLLVGLIRSNSPDRLHEESIEYRVEGDGSSESD
jgi:hypothetical protein